MDGQRLTRAAREALSAAEEVAKGLRHGRFETGHLLLGLLGPGTALQRALREAGVAPEKLRAAVAEVYDGPELEGQEDLVREALLKDALEASIDEAELDGLFEVQPAHLFLAATSDDRGSAYRALERVGAPVEPLRARVAELAQAEREGGDRPGRGGYGA